jgi:signal transduction histidine kinase
MKAQFEKLPIGKKLITIIFSVCMLILTVSMVADFFVQWNRHKNSCLSELQSIARVIGQNSSAGILFEDCDSLVKILESLNTKGSIVDAKILKKNQLILADYQGNAEQVEAEDYFRGNDTLLKNSHAWQQDNLEVLEPIYLDNEKIGSIYIKANMSDLYSDLYVTAFYLTLILSGGLLLAAFLANRLQLIITTPITRLAQTIKQVSEEKNYSLRTNHSSSDEMGQLAAGFNEMIEQIEIRDSHLESLVEDRTLDLKKAMDEALELAKKAKAANEAKSKFLATMSHEIRTPLNGIVGILELLTRSKLDPEQRHYLELLSKSSDWLMRVINDVLDYSKIEAGELILENVPFRPKETLENLVGLYRSQAESKQLGLRLRLTSALPEVLVGDQFRLTQILGNLISNAIKFTDNGLVDVSASSSVPSESQATLRVIITDTGVGISGEERKKIFEPFQQGQSKTSRKAGGSGLGLSICSRLVEIMQGSISIEDNHPLGTKFTVDIPFSMADGASVIPQIEAAGEQGYGWKRAPVILLVDDNEINREVNSDILSQLGCEVETAENGQQALELLESKAIDLILMDCEMPVLDGYETSRRIRRQEAAAKAATPLPIIALTAHVTQKDKQMCLDAGMDDYLGKPFRHHDLEDKLHFWLRALSTEQRKPVDATTETFPGQIEAEQADAEIRNSLHDLRNALSGVIGYAELGRRKQDMDSKNFRYFQNILDSAERANRILATIKPADLKSEKDSSTGNR